MKVLSLAVVLALAGILATTFVLAIGPEAERERHGACRALKPTPRSVALGPLPRPAPEVRAVDVTGKETLLSSYRGRVVLLNFWATWCPPCVDEMPAMEALSQRLGGEAFSLVALASERDWPTVRSFFSKGTSMTVLLDAPTDENNIGPAAAQLGTSKLPESYLIDKQGNIRYYFVNQRDWGSSAALQCMRSLLDE
jgi:thiol-disulfide isomerase/thioredoxin